MRINENLFQLTCKTANERDITEEEVYSVLTPPVEFRESIKGRKKVRKRITGKEIEVVFVEERDRIVIVTAIDKTR